MLGGVYILMAIMLVLGSLMTRREPAAKLFTMALTWVVVFAAGFVLFTFRDNLGWVAQRLKAEAIGTPVEEGQTTRKPNEPEQDTKQEPKEPERGQDTTREQEPGQEPKEPDQEQGQQDTTREPKGRKQEQKDLRRLPGWITTTTGTWTHVPCWQSSLVQASQKIESRDRSCDCQGRRQRRNGHERARGTGAVTDTAPQDRFPPAVLVGHGSEFAAKMPFKAAASMPAEQTSPLPVGLQR